MSQRKVWIQAVRTFSFTASAVPVLFGAALAAWQGPKEPAPLWWTLPVILVASILFQAATNLVSDAYDFKKGVDRPGTQGSSGVLVAGLLKQEQVHKGGILLFAIGSALGLGLVALRGWPLAALGVIGLLGGYLYTGGPKGYKYVALGDPLVGLLMGPLMVLGSYFVLTGEMPIGKIFIQSIPVALLVIAILHGNNMRDINDDAQSGFRTLAGLLGFGGAQKYYLVLIVGSYLSVIAMALVGLLPSAALIVAVSLIPALQALKAALSSTAPSDPRVRMLDVQSAQLHLAFGVLLTLGTLAGLWLGTPSA